jgi:hypothetical protein
MLDRFPQLTGLIASCNNAAIVAELQRGRDAYRAAIAELLDGTAPAADGEVSAEGAPAIDFSTRHPLLQLSPRAREPAALERMEDDTGQQEGSSEPRRPWVELATPPMQARARAMDELEKLSNDQLRRRRDEVTVNAVGPPSDAQRAALQTLEDIEKVPRRGASSRVRSATRSTGPAPHTGASISVPASRRGSGGWAPTTRRSRRSDWSTRPM